MELFVRHRFTSSSLSEGSGRHGLVPGPIRTSNRICSSNSPLLIDADDTLIIHYKKRHLFPGFGTGNSVEETMSPELSEDIKAILKAGNNLKNVGALLRECEKLISDLNRNAFVLETRVDKLDKALGVLKGLRELIATAGRWREKFLNEAHRAQERFKNTIAAELAKLLRSQGLEIIGNFPELKCAILTLGFSFEKGGAVRIYYGPKVSLLKKVPVEAEKIAEAVISLLKELGHPPLDDEQFIKELYAAYTRALARGEGEGEQPPAVPIGAVMQEMAFLKQKRSFRIDPKKKNFTSYGRVKFSYDLARLKTRRCGEKELRLVVASMEQTKKEETSLWVPKIPQGDGTHYASVAFA